MIKEINKEDIMPFQSLQSKIGLIFDGFRNNNISSDDYHVLLYLISAYKDNLFSIELVNDNSQTKERLIEQLRNSNNDSKSQYYKIFQIFEPTIQRLSENAIKHFFTVFGYLNKQVLIDNFSDIFDGLLYRILKSQGRYGAEFVYWVDKAHTGHGVATKMVSEVTEQAFRLGYWNVVCHTDVTNLGSQKVLEKNNFGLADRYLSEPRGLKDSGEMIAWIKFNPYSRNPFGPKRSALEMLKPRTFQLNNRGF